MFRFCLERLAGAGGFEPPPSSLTVRCPTDWTTPQRAAIPDACGESLFRWARPQKMRARLNLTYHERAEPREARKKIKPNKKCIERALALIRGSKEAQTRESLAPFRCLPDANCKAAPGSPRNLNFSLEKSFSKFTMQKFSRKSIGLDVAFQKVLLETRRSKLARVFALPG